MLFSIFLFGQINTTHQIALKGMFGMCRISSSNLEICKPHIFACNGRCFILYRFQYEFDNNNIRSSLEQHTNKHIHTLDKTSYGDTFLLPLCISHGMHVYV